MPGQSGSGDFGKDSGSNPLRLEDRFNGGFGRKGSEEENGFCLLKKRVSEEALAEGVRGLKSRFGGERIEGDSGETALLGFFHGSKANKIEI